MSVDENRQENEMVTGIMSSTTQDEIWKEKVRMSAIQNPTRHLHHDWLVENKNGG